MNAQKRTLVDILSYYLQRILNGVQDLVEDEDVLNILDVFNEDLNMNIYNSAMRPEDYNVRLHRLKRYACFVGEPKSIIIATFVPIIPFPGENVRYTICIRKDTLVTTLRLSLPFDIE